MEKETRLFIAEVRRFHGIESSNPDHVIQSRAPTLGSFADDVGDEDGGASDLSLTSVLKPLALCRIMVPYVLELESEK
jgi:hypothetical protein